MKFKDKITADSEKWIYGLLPVGERFPKPVISFKRKEKIMILFANPIFVEQIAKIRRKFNIPQNGFINFDKSLSWAKKNLNNRYNHKLKELMIEFKIGARWRQVIEYYLLCNLTNVDHLIPDPVNIQLSNENDEFVLRLEIFKDTELSDIRDIFKQIKQNQSFLGHTKNNHSIDQKSSIIVPNIKTKKVLYLKSKPPKRYKSYEGFKKHKDAYNLRQQGKSYKDIAKELKCDYSRISTYIKRFQNAINNNELP